MICSNLRETLLTRALQLRNLLVNHEAGVTSKLVIQSLQLCYSVKTGILLPSQIKFLDFSWRKDPLLPFLQEFATNHYEINNTNNLSIYLVFSP